MFTYFSLILRFVILLLDAFGKTFHQGQLLFRRFCLRGSSCRQTNSLPKLLFWQLAKRTWLNLEKRFFEWSEKKVGILPLFTLFISSFRGQTWLAVLKVKWRRSIYVHYIASTNSDSFWFCACCRQSCLAWGTNSVSFLIEVLYISIIKDFMEYFCVEEI